MTQMLEFFIKFKDVYYDVIKFDQMFKQKRTWIWLHFNFYNQPIDVVTDVLYPVYMTTKIIIYIAFNFRKMSVLMKQGRNKK
jgi:hypothetical protein